MNKSHAQNCFKKAFILSFSLVVVSNVALSQQNSTVIIVDKYKPTISDAFKENALPKINDTVVEKLSLNYTISPKLYPTTFNVEPIKPAKITGDPLVKFYKSYIKAGFGTKTTPLLEFSFNNLRSTDQSIGIYYRHLSSAGKIKDYAFPGFSNNDAAIYASKFYKYHTLTGKVDYNRNVIHYYGFNPNLFPSDSGTGKDSIRQRYSYISGQVKFRSNYKDSSKLNHAFLLRYSNLSDYYLANEGNIFFSAALDSRVKFFGKKVDNQNLGLKADVDYYNDMNHDIKTNSVTTRVMPHYSAAIDVLKFDIGWNVFVKTANDSKVSTFPEAKVDINLFNNVFIIYAGVTADLQKNSLKSLSDENPYINSRLPMAFTQTKSKFYGGFKGCLGSYLSFNASISKSKIDSLPLFVNDTTAKLMNKFTVIYDNANVFNSHTEITFQKSEKFKVMLIANYYQYTMENELSAWHRPSMDIKFAFNYNLKNKIILKTDVAAFSSVDAKTYNTSGTGPEVIPVSLKGTVDFSLGLEYRYSKILSAFVNFNNIGAVRYKQWNNYPAYGFNALAGVSYAF